MYRLILESLLGLTLEVDHLRVAPRLPEDWAGFVVHYRHRETPHRVRVLRVGPGSRVSRVVCDGQPSQDGTVALHADQRQHEAVVEVGDPEVRPAG